MDNIIFHVIFSCANLIYVILSNQPFLNYPRLFLNVIIKCLVYNFTKSVPGVSSCNYRAVERSLSEIGENFFINNMSLVKDIQNQAIGDLIQYSYANICDNHKLQVKRIYGTNCCLKCLSVLIERRNYLFPRYAIIIIVVLI